MIDAPSYRSFLVRLWQEPGAPTAWRGEVEYIQSGALVAVASLEEAFQLIERAAAASGTPGADDPPPQPPTVATGAT